MPSKYDSYTKAELLSLCESRKVKVSKAMKKQELIDAIKKAPRKKQKGGAILRIIKKELIEAINQVLTKQEFKYLQPQFSNSNSNGNAVIEAKHLRVYSVIYMNNDSENVTDTYVSYDINPNPSDGYHSYVTFILTNEGFTSGTVLSEQDGNILYPVKIEGNIKSINFLTSDQFELIDN